MLREQKGMLTVSDGKAIIIRGNNKMPLGNPHRVVQHKLGLPCVSTTIAGKFREHPIGIFVKFTNVVGVAFCEYVI